MTKQWKPVLLGKHKFNCRYNEGRLSSIKANVEKLICIELLMIGEASRSCFSIKLGETKESKHQKHTVLKRQLIWSKMRLKSSWDVAGKSCPIKQEKSRQWVKSEPEVKCFYIQLIEMYTCCFTNWKRCFFGIRRLT